MNIELIKKLVEHDLFLLDKDESFLSKKLARLLQMKLEEPASDKEACFPFYEDINGICYNVEAPTSGSYKKIGCKEQGWSWGLITGPSESSEFYSSDFFDKEDTELFEFFTIFYFGLFRTLGEAEAKVRLERLLSVKDFSEADPLLDGFLLEDLDLSEAVECMKWYYTEKIEESDEMPIEGFWLLVYGAYYLYCYSQDTSLKEEEMIRFNRYYGLCTGELRHVEEYLNIFLDRITECIDCSEDGSRLLLDTLLSLLFSYNRNGEGTTPTAYFYSSKPLKEYKELRMRALLHPLIPCLDRLSALLEDPASMIEESHELRFDIWDGECMTTYGYTKEEYICCYYYYDDYFEQQKCVVQYSYVFALARKCFQILMDAFKSDILKK